MIGRRAQLAVVCSALALLAGACSDDEPTGGTTTTTAGTAVGDTACDDPIGDVYLAADPAAAPTGRASGIDLVRAEADLSGEDLSVTFETVDPVGSMQFPELIAFGGAVDDPGRFELRAAGSDEGWVVRRVTFADGTPQDVPVQATVEEHGTSVTFTLRAGLLPLGDFVSFAFASTASEGTEALNDECFPFAGRTPAP